MVQCEIPPRQGSQVQILLPGLVVIGQVVWADAHRFGLAAGRPVDVDIILGRSKSPPAIAHLSAPGTPVRRRADATGNRPADSRARHERSRWIGQLLERGTIAVLGIAAVLAIGGYVHHELSQMAANASAGLDLAR